MLVLVTYDVKTESSTGQKRLRRISKHCLDFGQRVQYSVFECEVDPGQWERLKHNLLREYKESEDSLRFYFLGSNWKKRVEHHGSKPSTDFSEAIIL